LTDHLWPKVRKARSKEELHEEIHAAMHQVAEPGRMGNPKIKAKVFESAGEGFAEIYEDGEMVERSPHFDRLTKVHEWIRSNYPLVGKIPHVVKSKRRNPDTSAEITAGARAGWPAPSGGCGASDGRTVCKRGGPHLLREAREAGV